jgi:hypothetical protein
MLRHGCGYALANAGHDTRALQAWLGHKNIQHTVRYTALARTGLRTSGDRPFVAIGVTSAADAAAPAYPPPVQNDSGLPRTRGRFRTILSLR